MALLAEQPLILAGEGWGDYGLVDSGHGRKLERYGQRRFIRPEPQAMWAPRQPAWQADGEFVPGSDEDGGGRWQFARPVPADGWPLAWNDVRFTAQCTPFRHLGFFPDMAPVWSWMRDQLAGKVDAQTLNLFGYTGVGSLALAGLLAGVLTDLPGRIEHGDLAVREDGDGARLLPTAIFARWSHGRRSPRIEPMEN